MWGYLISAIFVTLSLQVVGVKLVTPLNFLLHYGKVLEESKKNQSLGIKSLILNWTVPKSYFRHFYVLLVALLAAIALTLSKASDSNLLKAYAEDLGVPLNHSTYTAYHIIYGLYWVQALRRTHDTFVVTKFGPNARIGVTHYVFGLGYYVLVSANIFLGLLPFYTNNFEGSLSISWPIVIAGFLFFYASFDQYRNHVYLASLVKYTMPTQGPFRYLTCPHFFDEILIYVSINVVAFSKGHVNVVDWNFLAILSLVVSNLSVSAMETNAYYRKKFDEYNVRWCIIPGVL